jgi:hypothetical protein
MCVRTVSLAARACAGIAAAEKTCAWSGCDRPRWCAGRIAVCAFSILQFHFRVVFDLLALCF